MSVPGTSLSRARLLPRLWWLPAAVAFTVLRLPSLLQPHWYTDEAGYASAGREMLHGRVPYSDIWNNKPPLHLATVGAVVRLAGSSETALHLLTFAFGAIALAGAAYLSVHVFSPLKAATVTLLAAGLLGLPLFDADLAIPESLLIAPATWAAAIVIVRLHRGRSEGVGWAVAAGLLAAATVCFQQTALADAGALGLILLVHPRARVRHFAAYALAAVLATLAWVVPFAVLAGPRTLGFAMIGFYAGDYNLSALPDAHTPLHYALLGLCVVFAVGGAVAARLCMGRTGAAGGAAWMLGVWAVATLLVPAAAQQPFPHFAAPAALPTLLAVAAFLPDRGLRLAWRPAAALAAAPLVAAVVIAGLMARSAGVDWIPHWDSGSTNGYRTLSTYYVGAMEAWTGHLSWTDWEQQWDNRAPADTAVSAWLREHGLSGHRAVVWSSDAWPYLLADLPVLLPTAPIYNDEVLLGQNGEVTDRVRLLEPEIIVTSDDAVATFPEINPLVKSHYREVFASAPDHVFLRDGDAVPGSGP